MPTEQLIRSLRLLGALAVLLTAFGSTRAQDQVREEARRNLEDPDTVVRLRAVGALSIYFEDEDAEPLIGLLDDPDKDVRAAAARTLGDKKVLRSVHNLIFLLSDDPEGIVKVAAAWALGNIGDSGAIEPMLEIMAKANLGIKYPIIQALARFDDPRTIFPLFDLRRTDVGSYALAALGPSAADPMCEIISDRTRSLDHWYAMVVLKRVADETSTPCLLSILRDDESGLGREAAETLAWKVGPTAIDPLLAAAREESWRTRVNALIALTLIANRAGGSKDHIPELLQPGQSTYPDWPTTTISGGLMIGFRSPKDDRIVDALLAAMSDRSPEVRVVATVALRNVVRDDITAALLRAMSDPVMRPDAAYALGTRRDTRAIPLLVELLTGEDIGAAIQAQQMLITFGIPAVDSLIGVLTDKNPQFPIRQQRRRYEESRRPLMYPRCGDDPPEPILDPRTLAAVALGAIGDERAREPLKLALKDKAEWLREASKIALEAIEKKRELNAEFP